jgi:hypothetical protein
MSASDGSGGAGGGAKAGSAPASSGKSCRFTGSSTNTGPGTPDVAMRYASKSIGTTSACDLTWKVALVSGFMKACWSISCNW